MTEDITKLTARLKSLQAAVRIATQKKAELEGRRNQLLEQLQKEFGLTPENADKKLEELQRECSTLTTDIEDRLSGLEKSLCQ